MVVRVWSLWPHLPLVLSFTSSTHLVYQYLTRTKDVEVEVQNNHERWIDQVRGYDVARVLCCSCLVVISALKVFAERGTEIEEMLAGFIFLYALVLALLPWSKAHAHTSHSTHLTVLLLSVLCLLLSRCAWLYAMYSTSSSNTTTTTEVYGEWSSIFLLLISGVIIPLIKPRHTPSKNPAPEQRASYFSLLSYSFLNPIIWLGYRSPRISAEELPPLADFDQAEVLRELSFKTLDRTLSKSNRHIFIPLLSLFLPTIIQLVGLLIVHSLSAFVSPLAINRLLRFLEVGREEHSVRPWVWVVLLFVGPMMAGVALQWYIFIATRSITQVESILTQLVYEHVLRIRINVNVDTKTAQNVNESKEEATQKPTTTAESNLNGKINSLITTDLANIREARDVVSILVFIPLHVALAIWFLYAVLGWSAFVGLATIVALIPIPGYVASCIQQVEIVRMGKTDGRVQDVTETLNVLRMIKLFGWEHKASEKLNGSREEELESIKRRQVLNMVKGISNFLIPVVTMLATYATYVTLLMHQPLTPSKVFSSMSVFDILRGQFHLAFHTISQLVTGKVSLDRVDAFLSQTEVLDSFGGLSDSVAVEPFVVDEPPVVDSRQIAVGFENAEFTWSNSVASLSVSTPPPFKLRINDPIYFSQGSITVVVGPTGSGKTSLLMALLGEMHLNLSGTKTRVSLPKPGSVAYAPQETWVLNDTIRNNITFNSPFNAHRYHQVLKQCALEKDIALFLSGDMMEIGEKGVTLSGGQKARITLARAVYSDKEILLLDDVFAALDVHTSQWIAEKCFGGDLVKGRTVLLVTHNLNMAKTFASHILAMGEDGHVASYCPLSKAIVDLEENLVDHDDTGASSSSNHEIVFFNQDLDEQPVSDTASKGALVAEEETEVGRVSWEALSLYFSNLGGRHYLLFFFSFGGGIIVNECLAVVQTWYLGYWAAQYNGSDNVRVLHYLGTYAGILGGSMVVYASAYVIYIYGTLRASRIIHKKLVSSILGTTLRWLDVTPTSRIIARCTQDIGAVDGIIAGMVQWLTELTVSMTVKLAAIVFVTPIFLGPGLSVAILGGWLCQVYMASQLSLKREMSNAKAPVIGHFGTTVSGLVSLRAYGAQESFTAQSQVKIDRYTRAARTFFNLNRWITIRTDFLGAVFTSALAAYLVYFQGQSASNTGFSLNMSIAFSGMILYWVMFLNDLEIQGNSLERIQSYLRVEQEPKATPSGIPPAYWPASGELRVENLSSRYSEDGPEILHNLSFHIKAGEHIGIVGRTGSGKSSLALSLLRSIVSTGAVYYDQIRTDTINLDSLRSSITIIPQIPEMLRGTLRQNLDPYEQYDDAHLNDALRASGLFSLPGNEENSGAKRSLTLDTVISSGGANLSIGQIQILALARAIVRGSKLLVLDEATSSIDHDTDVLIQSTLRHQLGPDVTLLIVAHRLHTIMDADKIMVLEEGTIVEFDTPASLLTKPGGVFRNMVESSNDKENLLKMLR